MDASNLLERLLDRAESDPAVLAVLLFGSRARGQAVTGSDVDVCLILQPDAPANPTEVRLTYVSSFDLDIQVFQALPLYVRSRVLKEGQVLVAKDEDALYELAIRTAKAFEDFKPQYRRYVEAVLGA